MLDGLRHVVEGDGELVEVADAAELDAGGVVAVGEFIDGFAEIADGAVEAADDEIQRDDGDDKHPDGRGERRHEEAGDDAACLVGGVAHDDRADFLLRHFAVVEQIDGRGEYQVFLVKKAVGGSVVRFVGVIHEGGEGGAREGVGTRIVGVFVGGKEDTAVGVGDVGGHAERFCRTGGELPIVFHARDGLGEGFVAAAGAVKKRDAEGLGGGAEIGFPFGALV